MIIKVDSVYVMSISSHMGVTSVDWLVAVLSLCRAHGVCCIVPHIQTVFVVVSSDWLRRRLR